MLWDEVFHGDFSKKGFSKKEMKQRRNENGEAADERDGISLRSLTQ
jgi:hypothetical protein